MDFREYIAVDPEIRSGKPIVKGTRITVQDVLENLASGMSVDEVLSDFPRLTRESVLACLQFAAEREARTYSPL